MRSLTEILTEGHHRLEAQWAKLAPALVLVADGRDSPLGAARLAQLMTDYNAHADFEEQTFLPLAQQILGRDPNHLAALDLSMHLRHALPEALSRYGQHR